MARTFPQSVRDALKAGTLVVRDFIWIEAKDGAGNPVEWAAWSDVGSITADVIDPVTGATVNRTFKGAGELIEVSPIPLTSGLTVQAVEVLVSQISPEAETLIRGHNIRRAPIQIHRGFMDPMTQLMIAPAEPRFFGFIDEAPVETPSEGEEGGVTFTCTGHTQELTRRNHAKRSDADQRRRSASDSFFKHAAAVGTWEIKWGTGS